MLKQARGRMLLVTFFLIACQLGACVYLPVTGADPYPEKMVSSIRVNESTKEDVLNVFGNPDVVREKDSIWVYGDYQGYGFMMAFKYIGWTEISERFVIFKFDKDVVQFFEYVKSGIGCSSNGMCLTSDWGAYPFIRLKNDWVEITATAIDEAVARNFSVSNERCGVYVYNSGSNTWINLDTYGEQRLTLGNYAYTEVAPGFHRLTRLWSGKSIRKQISFLCEAGGLVFIEVHPDMYEGSSQELPEIVINPEQKGKFEVLRRKRVYYY
ncbi:hypothetical protein O5O45_26290 [Hahella aquimaris]|uniref:hypothetical protein n=1 Tax=Hahella sp. HNIBRBA332 TaxID=3015983 RepID=UPI00273CE598|nr:hypothetical protein [Hahella sp. HNIBRBA332]WLQ13244.1 hypothetical protein O5O45_26290 [Hahella sp. HNIBRBA332]